MSSDPSRDAAYNHAACAGEHTCEEVQVLTDATTHLKEELFLMTGERNELVLALRQHGQHFGCMLGRAVGGEEVPQGVGLDGNPVQPGGSNSASGAGSATHGCTCGLRLLLARYKKVKGGR